MKAKMQDIVKKFGRPSKDRKMICPVCLMMEHSCLVIGPSNVSEIQAPRKPTMEFRGFVNNWVDYQCSECGFVISFQVDFSIPHVVCEDGFRFQKLYYNMQEDDDFYHIIAKKQIPVKCD